MGRLRLIESTPSLTPHTSELEQPYESFESRVGRQLATLKPSTKRSRVSVSLTIHMRHSASTGETIDVIVSPYRKRPISGTISRNCVIHTDFTAFPLLGKMLSTILTHAGCEIGSVLISQMIPFYNIILYTLNFHTISASSPRSIQHIHSTKMKSIHGKKVATSMISGGITERIRASL